MRADSNPVIETNLVRVDPERVTPQENRQGPVRRRPARPRSVPIPTELIAPLNEHHRRLEGYIKGFVTFQTLRSAGAKIRNVLESPSDEQTKWSLRGQIRPELEEIQGALVVHEMWMTEFGDRLVGFQQALDDAFAFMNDEGGPFSDTDDPSIAAVIVGMTRPIEKLLTNAIAIEGLCRNNAQEEVQTLGRYVNQIFDRWKDRPSADPTGSNRATEARYPPSEEKSKPIAHLGRLQDEELNITGTPRTEDTTNGR